MNTLSRREMIQVVAGVAVAPLLIAHSATRPQGVEPVVPERIKERFRSLPFEGQQIGGVLGDRMTVNVEGRLKLIDANALLDGFINHGSTDSWVGEHAGKFLDAGCNAVRYRDDAELRALIDRIAKTLIASQEADGYLGTYAPDRRWMGWDVWVHKYTLIGLLGYYELTGDPAALAACRKIGDLLNRTFGDAVGQRDIIAAGAHMGMAATSVLEPMCTLYRFTGDERYLAFCHYIVRSYGHPNGPRIVTSLLEHGSVYLTANAKAYEMLSNLNGLVDLYRITGEEKLFTAVLRAWGDIIEHQLYFTGTAELFRILPAERPPLVTEILRRGRDVRDRDLAAAQLAFATANGRSAVRAGDRTHCLQPSPGRPKSVQRGFLVLQPPSRAQRAQS